MRQTISSRSKRRIIILDGGWGTELQKKGMPAGVMPEIWCLENQETLASIHQSYAAAGAEVVYSATFGANRGKLPQYSAKEIASLNKKLVQIARQAVGKNVLVAGDIGPTGRFVEPFGDLAFEEAVSIFREQAKGLIAGGADLIAIETMIDIQEARAALIAIKETAPIFTIVTMTFEPDGRTLGGTDPISALVTLQALGADAVGCNCSLGPDGMVELIAKMKPFAQVPLVAKPNAGLPKMVNGETLFNMPALEFASYGKALVDAGANFVGGCCGTTPAHIKALRKKIALLSPRKMVKSANLLSSPRESVVIAAKGRLLLIGERLNPTGKKALQADISSGKFASIRAIALEQERQGADLIDVNVGIPGIVGVAAMRRIVSILATCTSKPLVIDSGNPEAIAAALRLYPGRVLLNSISGEKTKLKTLPPLAKKYGAMFVLLPLTDKGLPPTSEERVKVVNRLLQHLAKKGLKKEDAVVDGLTLSVATDMSAGEETLKTIRYCTEKLKLKTVLGISNVSFGMPARGELNASMLAMARSSGLTMAIVNPAIEAIRSTALATDLLLGFDADARVFLKNIGAQQEVAQASPQVPNASPVAIVAEALMNGARENILEKIQGALQAGVNAKALVDEIMIPAIVEVGSRYERREFFLPQLVASAETMKMGMDFLEGLLAQRDIEKNAGTIILATVEGDIHDIGKNIVGLLLKNHGYRVLDLGKDCPAEKIITAIEKENPDFVGLSALMTTTMIKMPEVINRARQKGLETKFIVGGAVLNSDYAQSIGALYAKDAVGAVALIQKIVKR
ncbi:MAG: homocysteine S-methyltransferase family protein [Deltaproteobacteria bacterium]|nr:homocysteine S-methyltransferase family protein [Deltaproteobacteria bacterium]